MAGSDCRRTGDPGGRGVFVGQPVAWWRIVFDAKPTTTYIVLHSFNLCHWQEILRVKSQQSGPMAVSVRFDSSQGFWRIESFAEQ